MLHIILCDDNPRHNQTMTYHLEQIMPRLTMPCAIDLTTTDPREVIAHAKQQHDGDLVYLLDLEMENDLNGLDVCAIIREHQVRAHIIYVSAYAEYAMECCRAHAFDFILKPYTTQRLENAIRDVILHIERTRSVYPLSVTAGTVTQVLDQKEIRYLQVEREYVTAHMNGGVFTWRESLTHLLPRLNPDWFVRIHKSCAINRLYIQSVDQKAHEVILKGGTVLNVSRRLIKEVVSPGEGGETPQVKA
ncbi:MAG: response regulator transcription factor [Clostridiales bacterium]|nr:response regulator transcription factor [Clostridiales bacterium]